MDVNHKILVKLFELTGGKETVDVDLVELTKKEGYYPSIDEIAQHLLSESWVTQSRTNVVRLTHWGVAEAKRAGNVRPDAARAVERESRRLLGETREFGVVIEEFMADPTSERFKAITKKFGEMESILSALRGAL